MLEKLKTVTLFSLVIISIILSGILLYSTPEYAPLLDMINVDQLDDKTGYFKLEDIIKPLTIDLSINKNQHKTAYPDDTAFTYAIEWLKGVTITNIEEYSENIESIDDVEKDIINKYNMAIRFLDEMPMEYINLLIPINNDDLQKFNSTQIKRVMIFINQETAKLQCMLIGDKQYIANINIPTWRFADLLEDLVRQKFNNDREIINYSKQTLRVAELSNSLFADPTAIRQIQERDNSIIYTDGSRSLRINEIYDTMEFSNPTISSRVQEVNYQQMITNAMDFLNRHQSWVGHYYLAKIEPESKNENEYILVFRQYIEGLPVAINYNTNSAEIIIRMKNNQVTKMNRTKTYLGEQIEKTKITLLDLQDMKAIIKRRYGFNDEKDELYLAYYSIKNSTDTVKLTPAWMLTRNGRYVAAFDAQNGQEIRE